MTRTHRRPRCHTGAVRTNEGTVGVSPTRSVMTRGYHAGMVTHLAGASRVPAPQSEIERRTRELETLHAIGSAIAESLDDQGVLEGALQILVDQGWFSCGEALLLEGDDVRAVAVGLCPYDRIDRCPVRPAMEEMARAALEDGAVVRRTGWHLMPIDGGAVIALAGGEAVSDSFLEAVAALVASALKRTHLHARLAEKEKQRSRLLRAVLTAQEEERGRISRDLHDQIGQALTAILLGLDKSIADFDPKELRRLKELASVTLGDVRRIALDLRPSVLDELGLEAALRRFARDLHERYDLDVSVLVTLPQRLSRQEETVLYRVVQEALTNVVRHAGAERVSVVVTSTGQHVQLVVEDDGVGFDPEALVPAEKIGLMGMEERMELFGGTVSIESASGAGCTVYARLPHR